MSRSELHDWECAIEKLSSDNADKMLAIAQDIYNTAFVRGKNDISLIQEPCEDCISRQAAIDALSHMIDTDGFRDGWAVSRANVDCMLRSLPSAQPEVIRCTEIEDNGQKNNP